VALLIPAGRRALYTTRFVLMGGPALVRFVDRQGRQRAEALARAAEGEARRIEAKFSRYREDSVVSRINQNAGRAPVAVDGETARLLQTALDLALLTEGRFDPTVGILRHAWDFKAERVPSQAELDRLLPMVDAGAVVLGPGTAFLRHPGMEVDLGGVGKEYAVDRVADLLREAGVESAIVNFSGDVRTLGRRGDARPWSIGVLDPRERNRCRFAIRVGGSAGVATSGDYERAFVKDGVRYHHLLDARTGRPARGVASATVIAPTAFGAGFLATAAFLLGPEAGLKLLETSPGVEGGLITEEGRLLQTAGLGRVSDLRPGDAA
jgi:thiamine biosynthesis lipoprotein